MEFFSEVIKMRCMKIIFFVTVLALNFQDGLQSIQASLEAVPRVVLKGQDTSLKCNYDLHGAPLYTVKWYRGKFEFYRYDPKAIQPRKVFTPKGVPLYVDRELSNATQVTLRNLEFSMSGNYSCEVSADSPSFYTTIVHNHVDVVELPKGKQEISTNKFAYSPGDNFIAICKTNVSRPAPKLTFYINNEIIKLATREVFKDDNGLEWSRLKMIVPLKKSHFKNGSMVIKCLAQIEQVYAETSSLNFHILVDPKSERIMSSGSWSTNCANLALLILATFLLNINSWSRAQFDFESFPLENEVLGEDFDYESLQNSLLHSLK